MAETLTLRGYQERMQGHVVANTHCALWADMGAGKTATMLSAVLQLTTELDSAKVLVVAPKRVASHTWSAEVARWGAFEQMTVRTLTAEDFGFEKRKVRIQRRSEVAEVTRLVPTVRPQAFLTGEVIHTISRDLFAALVRFLGRRHWPYDLLILDDCGMRDASTKKSLAVKSLRKHFPARRIVMLSGTPRPKSLEDVWAQMLLLDQGERLGRTLQGFRERWFRPDKRSRDGRQIYSYAPLPGAEAEIFGRIGDLCVSLLPEDVVQLPEFVINVITLHFGDADRERYLDMVRHQIITVHGADVTAGNAAVLVGKLLQLASGAIYDEEGNVQHLHDIKLDCLEETVETLAGTPLLVGYWFAHERERIKTRFPHAVELDDYPDTEARWNRGEIEMLLLHPQGGAHGLNLQFNSGHGFWFGPIHNLELWQQWNKRMYRPGRKSPVFIHIPIVMGTIEEAVLAALDPKQAGQDRLLHAVRILVEDAER